MGILKNMVGSAISNGISKGISKGIGSAVGKAIENAVAPAAERMANKGAEAINSVTEELDKSVKQTNAALEEATAATAEAGVSAKEAVKAAGGLAGLESALAGWASRAESLATSMSASMKICPNCGHPSPAGKDFCPNCGTKLPEKTIGQEYTCEKCGTPNTPGTKFCSKCGALLPGAAAEVKAQQEKDEAVLAECHATLPQYPEWTCGGSGFEFAESGTRNGAPEYYLSFEGSQKELDAYFAKLLAAGFNKKDHEYWKTVDGVCRTTLAEVGDAGPFVLFYISNLDKPAPKPADPVADLKGMAKGMFKKILG